MRYLRFQALIVVNELFLHFEFTCMFFVYKMYLNNYLVSVYLLIFNYLLYIMILLLH